MFDCFVTSSLFTAPPRTPMPLPIISVLLIIHIFVILKHVVNYKDHTFIRMLTSSQVQPTCSSALPSYLLENVATRP